MFFFINNTNNKPACLQSNGLSSDFRWPCLSEFHWTSVGYVRQNSIGSGHFGGWFVVSPLAVHWKSPLDWLVWPEMIRPALENPRKNTVVKKQKNMDSAYPQSDGVHLEKQWECKDLWPLDHFNPTALFIYPWGQPWCSLFPEAFSLFLELKSVLPNMEMFTFPNEK